MYTLDVLIKFLKYYMGLDLKGPAYTNDVVIRERPAPKSTPEYQHAMYEGSMHDPGQHPYAQDMQEPVPAVTPHGTPEPTLSHQRMFEHQEAHEPVEYDQQLQEILLEATIDEFFDRGLEEIVNEPFDDMMDVPDDPMNMSEDDGPFPDDQMPDDPPDMEPPEPPDMPPDMFPDDPFPFGG